VSVSRPRRLAPAQAFTSQSGSGAAVPMKSCTLHDDDGRLAAPVDGELLVVLGRQVHDLTEPGAGDMRVDAAGLAAPRPGHKAPGIAVESTDLDQQPPESIGDGSRPTSSRVGLAPAPRN